MQDAIFLKICKFFENTFEFGVHRDNGSESVVWRVVAEKNRLPYLRAENCKGNNIYMRPLPEITGYFLLVDDLAPEQLMEHREMPGRMIVETSPANYQVWIRTSNYLSDESKKNILLQLGSDPGAAPAKRWGRAPGFTNRKRKHRMMNGFYPYAKLHYMNSNAVEMEVPFDVVPSDSDEESYYDTSMITTVVSADICRNDYEIGDDSRTDFRYCMALIKRGATDVKLKECLMAERGNWGNHKGGGKLKSYLDRTIRKARLFTK